MKIYAASSWRNMLQPQIVFELRDHHHEVYDFRNPPESTGFAWEEIAQEWKGWSREEYLEALKTERAEQGFKSDMDAMEWADVGVLVLGAGASAHLELGWFAGREGKRSIILLQPDYDDLLAKAHLKHLGHSMDGGPCPVCGDDEFDRCYLAGETLFQRRMQAVRMTPFEPELMYKMADAICINIEQVFDVLEAFEIDDNDHAP